MNVVGHILEDARRRLAVLGRDSSFGDAARILANPNTPLAVVCDRDGVAVGVVSSSDIVKALSRNCEQAIRAKAEAIMSAPISTCDAGQTLQSVWSVMGAGRLRCMPILDETGRPQGVVHARDIARALLDEVTYEELLLRDYVMGIGYQ